MTPIVHIRPYTPGDASALYEAARESLTELEPWMPWAHSHYSLDETRIWLKNQVAAFQDHKAFEFAIISDEGRYLGGCGLNQLDRENQRANLGYWVRSSAANRGVATAAVLLVRDWGFLNTGLVRLEIVIAASNIPSQRVAEKAGAVREGMLRSRLLLHGAVHDAVIFSFVREDRIG